MAKLKKSRHQVMEESRWTRLRRKHLRKDFTYDEKLERAELAFQMMLDVAALYGVDPRTAENLAEAWTLSVSGAQWAQLTTAKRKKTPKKRKG